MTTKLEPLNIGEIKGLYDRWQDERRRVILRNLDDAGVRDEQARYEALGELDRDSTLHLAMSIWGASEITKMRPQLESLHGEDLSRAVFHVLGLDYDGIVSELTRPDPTREIPIQNSQCVGTG